MKNTKRRRNWISRNRQLAGRTPLALTAALLLAFILAQSAQGQTFTALHSFDDTDGYQPYGALVQGTDGNLYGATYLGGASDLGTVFKITPSGTLTTLYNFCSQTNCADGEEPYGALIQATDGNFYGTTVGGGANADGSVFQITPDGTLTTLHSFCSQTGCSDGEQPYGGLIQATDGNLYGTTYFGGAYSHGTAFKITLSGALTTLHSFCADTGCTDGGYTQAGLIQGTDGNFYGTTINGGSHGTEYGTVFRLTPGGTLTTLYNFCDVGLCEDGKQPQAGVIQASDGNFYGTTLAGGSLSDGTVFKLTPGGTLTTLHIFCSESGCTDGSQPYAGLVQGTDGNLFGTTYSGGTSDSCSGGCGTIFQVTTGGTLTTVYGFTGSTGSEPFGGLIQDTDGSFYGTASAGGTGCDKLSFSCGTVFSFSENLSSFVKTQPTSGPLGTAVNILGTDLTGATSVSFNGTSVAFTAVSASLITTTVPPAGVSNGFVTVTTPPSTTLTSNLPFEITLANTSTAVTSSLNPSIYGQSMTFTATVSSPSGTPAGTVTFMNGSAKLGTDTLKNGLATLTKTTFGAGTKSITAVYGGTTVFAGSASPVLSQVVDKATSTLTMMSSENPSISGQSVTFTATVAGEFGRTPTGKVTFKEGSTVLGAVTLTDGIAAFTTSSLTSGNHKITAKYDGSANFSTSTAALTQTVN